MQQVTTGIHQAEAVRVCGTKLQPTLEVAGKQLRATAAHLKEQLHAASAGST